MNQIGILNGLNFEGKINLITTIDRINKQIKQMNEKSEAGETKNILTISKFMLLRRIAEKLKKVLKKIQNKKQLNEEFSMAVGWKLKALCQELGIMKKDKLLLSQIHSKES